MFPTTANMSFLDPLSRGLASLGYWDMIGVVHGLEMHDDGGGGGDGCFWKIYEMTMVFIYLVVFHKELFCFQNFSMYTGIHCGWAFL